MSSENAAWQWLRKGAADRPKIHLQRVENCLSRGNPDVEGCIDGVSFWLELKAGPCPAKETSKVSCEPLKTPQRRFIRQRLAAGGQAWILYRVDREVYLIHGEDAEKVRNQPRLKTLRELTHVNRKASPGKVLTQIYCGLPDNFTFDGY